MRDLKSTFLWSFHSKLIGRLRQIRFVIAVLGQLVFVALVSQISRHTPVPLILPNPLLILAVFIS